MCNKLIVKVEQAFTNRPFPSDRTKHFKPIVFRLIGLEVMIISRIDDLPYVFYLTPSGTYFIDELIVLVWDLELFCLLKFR
jgi:hypothetical protein